jgi:4-hydroxymandelate oxidase
VCSAWDRPAYTRPVLDTAGRQPINLFEYEAAAEKILPRHVWDFIAGGAQDEVTMRRNRSAFEALALRPRYLRDVRERSLATTMLGSEVSMPVFISPAGQQRPVHRDGAVATARAASGAGALMVVPSRELDETADVGPGPRWLQFYLRDRNEVEAAVSRAEGLGIRALVPTVDVPFLNIKERDRRNNFLPPFDVVLDARHNRRTRRSRRRCSSRGTTSPG